MLFLSFFNFVPNTRQSWIPMHNVVNAGPENESRGPGSWRENVRTTAWGERERGARSDSQNPEGNAKVWGKETELESKNPRASEQEPRGVITWKWKSAWSQESEPGSPGKRSRDLTVSPGVRVNAWERELELKTWNKTRHEKSRRCTEARTLGGDSLKARPDSQGGMRSWKKS